jgi:hypothetical protein
MRRRQSICTYHSYGDLVWFPRYKEAPFSLRHSTDKLPGWDFTGGAEIRARFTPANFRNGEIDS